MAFAESKQLPLKIDDYCKKKINKSHKTKPIN